MPDQPPGMVKRESLVCLNKGNFGDPRDTKV